MAANKNTKEVRSARARHAASKRKDRKITNPFPLLPTRQSACQTRCTATEGLDESHSGTPGPEESRAPSPMHNNPESSFINIENLGATRNALQAEATLAAGQGGEKPAKICQIEQEIARL